MKLPVLNQSAFEIAEALKKHISANYNGNYVINSETHEDLSFKLSVCIGTLNNAPLLFSIEPRESGFVIALDSMYQNGSSFEEMQLAKLIRLKVYTELGYVKQSRIDKHLDHATFKEVISRILATPGYSIEKEKEMQYETLITIVNIDCDKLICHYYPTKNHAMVQAFSSDIAEFFENTVREVAHIPTTTEQNEANEATITELREIEALETEMDRALGKDAIEYISRHNTPLLNTLRGSFNTKRVRKTSDTEDYSSMVQEACRCYESFMKTIFQAAGYKKFQYVIQYFSWNPKDHLYYLDRCYFPPLDNKSRRKIITQYLIAYGKHRNSVTHGGISIDHINVNDYGTALLWFNDIMNSIKITYSILKPFLKN